MKTFDLLKMCVENLKRRKFRTLLTVIGVVIGTAAIISMISLAIGIRKSTDDLISSWGDLSIIDVYPMPDVNIDDKALKTVSAMDGVKAVTPFLQAYYFNDGRLVAGKNDRYETNIWSIVGVYPDSLEEFGYKFKQGSPPTAHSKKHFFIVFGSDVPYEFRDTKRKEGNNVVSPFPDPVTGKTPEPFVDALNDDFRLAIKYDSSDDKKILNYDVKVSGILAGDAVNYYETRYVIYMDVVDLKKITDEYYKAQKTKNPEKGGYNSAKIKVGDIKKVAEIQQAIKDMGFETRSLESERQDALKETQNLQIILGALGGVSLIVAAISIANTMVMSVYERTREIGIMKVLGCFVKDIRTIFLTEAAMIGFLGGVVGVILSYIISFMVNYMAFNSATEGGGGMGGSMGGISSIMSTGDPTAKLSVIPLWLVLVGMLFATSVGVIAGFYPASRAVKISALEAIKQD